MILLLSTAHIMPDLTRSQGSSDLVIDLFTMGARERRWKKKREGSHLEPSFVYSLDCSVAYRYGHDIQKRTVTGNYGRRLGFVERFGKPKRVISSQKRWFTR